MQYVCATLNTFKVGYGTQNPVTDFSCLLELDNQP